MENRAKAMKWGLGTFPVAAIIFLSYFPFHTTLPGDGLDPSWSLGITYALISGLQFGRDIVFTYGPLGALLIRTEWPGLYPYVAIFWLALITLFLLAHQKLVGTYGAGVRLLTIAPLLLIFSLDAFILYFLFCVAYAARRIATNLYLTAIFSTALGVLALAKFTFLVGGTTVLLALAFAASRVRRTRPYASIGCFLGALILGWIACGQSLKNIPAFLYTGYEVTRGYTGAMAIYGTTSELVLGVLLLLVLGTLVVGETSLTRRTFELTSDTVTDIVRVLSACFISWMAFKQGYVRQDAHVFHFVAFVGTAILALRFHREGAVTGKVWGTLGVAALWFALYLTAVVNHELGAWQAAVRSVHHLKAQFMAVPKIWDDGWRKGAFAAAADDTRKAHPLPKVKGTVDILPWDISHVLVNELEWSPRPVMQSYSAYTPALARLNARHFESNASAPQHVFANVKTIDGRLPLQDDPLIWPQLLTRYDLVSADEALHLVRRPTPVRHSKISEIRLQETNGFWIVPESLDYDYAKLRAQPSSGFARRVVSLLYKPPELLIEIKLTGGRTHKARWTRPLEDIPFIISPLVENDSDLIMLGCRCDASKDKRVIAFRFTDRKGKSVPLATAPTLTAWNVKAGWQNWEGLRQFRKLAAIRRLSPDDAVQQNPIITHRGRFVLDAHAPAAFSFRPDQHTLTLCYGIREQQPWQQSEFDGVRFVVRASGTQDILIDDVIGPQGATKVAAEQCRQVHVPQGVSELVLETQPNGTSLYDWSYWAPK